MMFMSGSNTESIIIPTITDVIITIVGSIRATIEAREFSASSDIRKAICSITASAFPVRMPTDNIRHEEGERRSALRKAVTMSVPSLMSC